jgi:hypothetical protein
MDWTMTDDELPQDVHALRPEEREIVPAGVHRATIKKAEERCVEWKKNDANPSGECLSLRLSVGNFQYVFADIPSDKAWLARQLAEALGIVSADGTLRIVPGDIEGEEIEVEFKHFTNRQGITKADVKAYVPKATQAAAAPPAKRQTLPQKAAATFRANGGADDIPFAWLMAAMIAAIGGGA